MLYSNFYAEPSQVYAKSPLCLQYKRLKLIYTCAIAGVVYVLSEKVDQIGHFTLFRKL